MQSNQELYFYAGVLVRSFFRSVSSVGNKISDHQRRLPSPFTNNSHVKQKIVRLVRLSRMHFYSLNSGYPLDNGSRKKDSRTHRVYIFGWINFMDLSLFAECRTTEENMWVVFTTLHSRLDQVLYPWEWITCTALNLLNFECGSSANHSTATYVYTTRLCQSIHVTHTVWSAQTHTFADTSSFIFFRLFQLFYFSATQMQILCDWKWEVSTGSRLYIRFIVVEWKIELLVVPAFGATSSCPVG